VAAITGSVGRGATDRALRARAAENSGFTGFGGVIWRESLDNIAVGKSMAVTRGGSIRDRLMAQLRDGDGITEDGTPDQWIGAEQAVELLTPPSKSTHITQKTICARAHNGLIRSRAEQLQADQAILKTHTVPAEFWWAEGEAALTQNWRTGDFDTWIDQEVHLRAFGVVFACRHREADSAGVSPTSFFASLPICRRQAACRLVGRSMG
jgi:hypothetical protein